MTIHDDARAVRDRIHRHQFDLMGSNGRWVRDFLRDLADLVARLAEDSHGPGPDGMSHHGVTAAETHAAPDASAASTPAPAIAPAPPAPPASGSPAHHPG